jgi:hypothetical protein
VFNNFLPENLAVFEILSKNFGEAREAAGNIMHAE